MGGAVRRAWLWRTEQLAQKPERGAALLVVIGIGLVLLTLVATAMTFSVSGSLKATGDQNWNGAMAAAYAGVDEYESRLANDNTYYRFGNPAAAFSSGSTLIAPIEANPAFGAGATGGWASVAGGDGTASFRYEVDNSAYSSSGVLRIRSTGRVGTKTRSVVANLKQAGFIDFLYFTMYEIQDPAQSGVTNPSCADTYAWAGRPAPSGGWSVCSDVAFGGGDVVNGPVHSNDTIRVCDATFNGKVTTGNPGAVGANYLRRNSAGSNCGGQVFNGGLPTNSPVIAMPATNASLRGETRTDAGVAEPGCLYTGPTSIVLNSNGTMTIRSPWSRATRVVGEPATSGSMPAACGMPGTGTGALGSSGGATVPVLDANLLFVQSVPLLTADPNFRSATTWPTGQSAATCAAGNGIGFPRSNENVASIATSYGCRHGDAFIKGTLAGTMTVATDNFLYVTGNIIYADTAADVLGLVAQNALWIWNPVCTGWGCPGGGGALLPDNRRIDAAMLSLDHTVQVQNNDRGGSQGVLTINGSLAQKYRGIVRVTNSSGVNGYSKNYTYDPRFRYIAPPKYLSPVAATYGVSLLVEVTTAFTAAGALIP
ncbi:hypothetical protein [Cryobacterium serini]|uniref:Uncharacterized protein n=1 Tax=Cryobacterium serini TaxID=1259201 RepID=A0A4R9BQ10_9MICO|nr:hypothetical protein [Cryobacterium serini]TFD87749.1 hypothetical protein E3T51_09745 [Cryobacterium serini]